MTRPFIRGAFIALCLLVGPRVALALEIQNVANDLGVELWLVEDHANPDFLLLSLGGHRHAQRRDCDDQPTQQTGSAAPWH